MKIQLDQTAYWDKVANLKQFNHQINWEIIEKYIHPESKILDFGCGYGRICHQLKQRGYLDVKGVDSSKRMIRRGKQTHAGLNLKWVNEFPLPFKRNSFDAVFLFAVLTCMPLSQDQGKLMRELERILKPGGALYLSDLLINQDTRNQKRYREFMLKYDSYGIFELPEGGVFRHHADSYLKAMLNQFDIVWEKSYDVTTMNGNASNAIQIVALKS